MAKKKVHRPKKANATKPRRRPLGRGSGPVVDDGAWVSDPGAQRYLGPGDAVDLARDGYEDDPETVAEREARLALLAEVESIPEERVAAALLGNPLVAHLGEVLLSGADDDEDPVVAAPDGLRPLQDDEVAVLKRWSRAALLLHDRSEADALAAEWREGGQPKLLAARAALAQHLMAVVEGDDADLEAESLAWLGGAATAAGAPGSAAGSEEELRAAALDVERGEVVIDLVARLALTGRVRLADVVADSPAGDPVLRDTRLLAAAGLFTVEELEDGVHVQVDPDLRGVLLDVADDLVTALHDDDLADLEA
ncbi:hypothetical protein FHN55_20275 [Streptomyces sp. NP160]|uniref:hypothetical protein n=1 Tax=Streptomyces sp. NP160 TaxID=2586637 RepID=UPI001118F079|nr:hypothetical protein [Streptomyces sp. NP160]TNM59696.1 hypothetical protein FHN55_20275 [Streptomyces sp. NP160]